MELNMATELVFGKKKNYCTAVDPFNCLTAPLSSRLYPAIAVLGGQATRETKDSVPAAAVWLWPSGACVASPSLLHKEKQAGSPNVSEDAPAIVATLIDCHKRGFVGGGR